MRICVFKAKFIFFNDFNSVSVSNFKAVQKTLLGYKR